MKAPYLFFVSVLILLFLTDGVAAKLFSLPYGSRAESVSQLDGDVFLASDFYSGYIYQIDAYSGATSVIVHPPPGRMALGMSVYLGLIFVAGGDTPPGHLYVYTASGGHQVADCVVPNGKLINDVVADGYYAYYTDSVNPAIYRMRISSLPSCVIDTIHLPEEPFTAGNDPRPRANGIVSFGGGLVVSNTAMRTIYFVDLRHGNKVSEILPPGTLVNPDGLDIQAAGNHAVLAVAESRPNWISLWRLSKGWFSIRPQLLGNITSNQLASSSAIALGHSSFMIPCFNLSAPFKWSPVVTFDVYVGYY